MNEMFPALGVLSSMITPAVLILASGSLIMTTSQRLGRVIERLRVISQEFMKIERSEDSTSANELQRGILYRLLRKSAQRSKLLTRAMIWLYVSLGLFVATSLAIGVVAITHSKFTWIPTAFGMIGAAMLFASSAVLIVESRLTYTVISAEVDFVIETSQRIAPASSKGRRKLWKALFGL